MNKLFHVQVVKIMIVIFASLNFQKEKCNFVLDVKNIKTLGKCLVINTIVFVMFVAYRNIGIVMGKKLCCVTIFFKSINMMCIAF